MGIMSTVFWSQCFVFTCISFFLPGISGKPLLLSHSPLSGSMVVPMPCSIPLLELTVPASYNQYTFFLRMSCKTVLKSGFLYPIKFASCGDVWCALSNSFCVRFFPALIFAWVSATLGLYEQQCGFSRPMYYRRESPPPARRNPLPDGSSPLGMLRDHRKDLLRPETCAYFTVRTWRWTEKRLLQACVCCVHPSSQLDGAGAPAFCFMKAPCWARMCLGHYSGEQESVGDSNPKVPQRLPL